MTLTLTKVEINRMLLDRSTPLALLKELIDNGVDINISDARGYHCSHVAALSNTNTIERLRLLVTQENINAKARNTEGYQNTPFGMLLINEAYREVLFLIEHAHQNALNLDYRIADSQGKTPLIMASKMRSLDVVSQLLRETERGYDVAIDAQDCEGNSALHYACMLGSISTVELLLRYGANPNIRNRSGRIPLDYTDYVAKLAADRDLIHSTLISVAIEPTRDEHAKRNTLNGSDEAEAYTYFCPSKKCMLRLCPPAKKCDQTEINLHAATPWDESFQSAFELAHSHLADSPKRMILFEMYNHLLLTRERKESLEALYKQFSGISILERALSDHRILTQWIENNITLFNLNIGLELRNAAAFGDHVKLSAYLNTEQGIAAINDVGHTTHRNALQQAIISNKPSMAIRILNSTKSTEINLLHLDSFGMSAIDYLIDKKLYSVIAELLRQYEIDFENAQTIAPEETTIGDLKNSLEDLRKKTFSELSESQRECLFEYNRLYPSVSIDYSDTESFTENLHGLRSICRIC